MEETLEKVKEPFQFITENGKVCFHRNIIDILEYFGETEEWNNECLDCGDMQSSNIYEPTWYAIDYKFLKSEERLLDLKKLYALNFDKSVKLKDSQTVTVVAH